MHASGKEGDDSQLGRGRWHARGWFGQKLSCPNGVDVVSCQGCRPTMEEGQVQVGGGSTVVVVEVFSIERESTGGWEVRGREIENKMLIMNFWVLKSNYITCSGNLKNLWFWHFWFVFCLKVVWVYKMISEHAILINIASITVVSQHLWTMHVNVVNFI